VTVVKWLTFTNLSFKTVRIFSSTSHLLIWRQPRTIANNRLHLKLTSLLEWRHEGFWNKSIKFAYMYFCLVYFIFSKFVFFFIYYKSRHSNIHASTHLRIHVSSHARHQRAQVTSEINSHLNIRHVSSHPRIHVLKHLRDHSPTDPHIQSLVMHPCIQASTHARMHASTYLYIHVFTQPCMHSLPPFVHPSHPATTHPSTDALQIPQHSRGLAFT